MDDLSKRKLDASKYDFEIREIGDTFVISPYHDAEDGRLTFTVSKSQARIINVKQEK